MRVGRPAASKVLTQWVVASGAPVVQVGGPGIIDPDKNVTARLDAAAAEALAAAAPDRTEPRLVGRLGCRIGAGRGAHRAGARRADWAHRTRRRADRRRGPARRCRAGGGVVDARARPRVVRRPGRGAGLRQPRRQRHRRHAVDRARDRPARRPGRRAARRHRVPARCRRPDRVAAPAGRPARRRGRQRRRRHLLVPAAGDGARRRALRAAVRHAPRNRHRRPRRGARHRRHHRLDARSARRTCDEAGAVGHSGGAPTAPPTSPSTRRSTRWHSAIGGWPTRPRPDRGATGGSSADNIAWNLAWVSASSAQRVAVGHDATTGVEAGDGAVVGELGAADASPPTCRCPRASTHPTAPAYRPRSTPSTSAMSASASGPGCPPTAGVGVSARTSVEHVGRRQRQPTLDRACPGAARWPPARCAGSGS